MRPPCGAGSPASPPPAPTSSRIPGSRRRPMRQAPRSTSALLTHPDALARLRADPALVRPAVEEALRWHSPVGTQTRQVTQRVMLAGVELGPGDTIAAVLASANRDGDHWERADEYVIDRRGAHAAFGLGSHHCAGAPFARHEVRMPLEMLLARFPQLRLDPERPVELRGWEFRAPTALHVRWD